MKKYHVCLSTLYHYHHTFVLFCDSEKQAFRAIRKWSLSSHLQGRYAEICVTLLVPDMEEV